MADEQPVQPQYYPIPAVTQPTTPVTNLPLAWMLTSSDALLDYEHSLRGEIWVEDISGGRYEKKGLQLMNEEGIRTLVSFVSMHTGKSVHLSNLTEDDVRIMCMKIESSLIDLLVLKQKDFNIDNKFFDLIKQNTVNFIYFSMTRGLAGFATDMIVNTTKQHLVQTYTEGAQPKKQGFLDKFLKR